MPVLDSYYKKVFEQNQQNNNPADVETPEERRKRVLREYYQGGRSASEVEQLLGIELEKQQEQQEKELKEKNLVSENNITNQQDTNVQLQGLYDQIRQEYIGDLLTEMEQKARVAEVNNSNYRVGELDVYNNLYKQGRFNEAEDYIKTIAELEDFWSKQTNRKDIARENKNIQAGIKYDQLDNALKEAKKRGDTESIKRLESEKRQLKEESNRPWMTGVRWIDNLGPTVRKMWNEPTKNRIDAGYNHDIFGRTFHAKEVREQADYLKKLQEKKNEYEKPYYDAKKEAAKLEKEALGYGNINTKLGLLFANDNKFFETELGKQWLEDNPKPQLFQEKFGREPQTERERRLQLEMWTAYNDWVKAKQNEINNNRKTVQNLIDIERQVTRGSEETERRNIQKLGAGSLDALDDIGSFGVNDMNMNIAYSQLEIKARENGEESLTPAEQRLALSRIELNNIRQLRQDAMSNWETIGEQGAQSVAFISQMALNPGGKTIQTLVGTSAKYGTRMLTKEGASWITKQGGKWLIAGSLEEAEKAGLKGVEKFVFRGANKLVTLPAEAIAAAPSMPMTWSMFGERFTGTWVQLEPNSSNDYNGVLLMTQNGANKARLTLDNQIDIEKNQLDLLYDWLNNSVGLEYLKQTEQDTKNVDKWIIDNFNPIQKILASYGFISEDDKTVTTDLVKDAIRFLQKDLEEAELQKTIIGSPDSPENVFYDVSGWDAVKYAIANSTFEYASEKLGEGIEEVISPIKKATNKSLFIDSIKESKVGKTLYAVNHGLQNLGDRYYATRGFIQSIPLETTEEIGRNFMYNPWGTKQEWKDQQDQLSDPNFYITVMGSTGLLGGFGAITNSILDRSSKQENLKRQNAYENIQAMTEAWLGGSISREQFEKHIAGILSRDKQPGALPALLSDLQKIATEHNDEETIKRIGDVHELIKQIGLISSLDQGFQNDNTSSVINSIRTALANEAKQKGLNLSDYIADNLFYKNLFKYADELQKLEGHQFINDRHKNVVSSLLYNMILNNTISESLANPLKDLLQKKIDDNSYLTDEKSRNADNALNELLSAKISEKYKLTDSEKLAVQTFGQYNNIIQTFNSRNQKNFEFQTATDEKSIESLKKQYETQDSENAAQEKNNNEIISEEGQQVVSEKKADIQEKAKTTPDIAIQIDNLTSNLGKGEYIQYNGGYYRKLDNGEVVKSSRDDIPEDSFIKNYKEKDGVLVNIDLEDAVKNDKELKAESDMQKNNLISGHAERIEQLSDEERFALNTEIPNMLDILPAPVEEDTPLSGYEKGELKRKFLDLIKKFHLSPEEILNGTYFVLSNKDIQYLKEEIQKYENEIDAITKEKWNNLDEERIGKLTEDNKNKILSDYIETRVQVKQEAKVNSQLQDKSIQQKSQSVKDSNILKVAISKLVGVFSGLQNKQLTITIADNWVKENIRDEENKEVNIVDFLRKKGVPVEKIVGLPIDKIRDVLTDKQFRLFTAVVPLQGTYKDKKIIGVVPTAFNTRYNPFISLIRDIQDTLRENNWSDQEIENVVQEFKNAVLQQEPISEIYKKLHLLEEVCNKKNSPIRNLISAHQQVANTAINIINRTRDEIAKYGKSKLTVKSIKKGIPEVNENNAPVLFANIKGNESFRFVCKKTNKNNQDKGRWTLMDVETGKTIPSQLIQNYDLVSRQLFSKPFILIKTGNTVGIKVEKDGKTEMQKRPEYAAVFVDDTRVEKSNDLVNNFLSNYEFLTALCHHDFNLGSFTFDYNGHKLEVTKENANILLNTIYDTLGFSNNASNRTLDELQSYLNRVYETLIDETWSDTKTIRVNFLVPGNEKVIVPLFNIGLSNGEVVISNKTDNPMTINDFRRNILSTKSKINGDGTVVLEDFIELTDSNPVLEQETTESKKEESVVDESNQGTNGSEISETKQQEKENIEERLDDSIIDDYTLDEDEKEIETTSKQVTTAKNIVNSMKKDSDNIFKISNLIKNIVFRKMTFRSKVKITDAYFEAQRTLQDIINGLPEGSEQRVFLEKNYDRILALRDDNNYVGSVRKLIDDFFKISKSLTDDYLAETLEIDTQADGYNVEKVYGKQSFEQDVTLSITTQLKMFLSGIIKSNENGVPEFYSEGEVNAVVQEAMNASQDHTLESCIQYLNDRLSSDKSNLRIQAENGEIKEVRQNFDILKAVSNRLQELVNLQENDNKADIKKKLKREIEYNFYNNKVAMSFVYCYNNLIYEFDRYDPYGGYTVKRVKEAMILDANRRNAVSKKEKDVQNNLRKLLKYDSNLKKYVYDKDKLKRIKELIERFQTVYQKSDDYIVKNGVVKESVFNDLKEIFNLLGIELDENTILDMFNYDTQSNVNPLEINNKKEHGYVIKYLTNLTEPEGQISVILNNTETIYTIDYVGGDNCVWTPYNTKTKKFSDSFTRPILSYNGKKGSGKAALRRMLNDDTKYTFNVVPGIYVGDKRVNSFENVRYIGKQMSLIIEGLKALYNGGESNDRAETLVRNLERSSFSRYSFLMGLAKKYPAVLSNIGLEWSSLEAFVIKGKTNDKKDKSSMTQLSEKDQMISLLAYFIGGIYGKPVYEEDGFSYYTTQFSFPALSDASVLPLLKTGAILFTKEQLAIESKDSKQKGFIDVKVKQLLFDTFAKGELMRIIDHIHYGKMSNINGIDNGSLIFTLLPALNAIKVDGISIIDKIRELCLSGLTKEQVYSQIISQFNTKINDTIFNTIRHESGRLFNKLKQNGIIEADAKGNVKKVTGNISNAFLSTLQGSQTEKITQLCFNYIVNSMIAQSDIYKLFAGDLACYNTDKLPSYFFGKNISSIDYEQLISYYIDKTYSGDKAALYKNAIEDKAVYNRLNDNEKKIVDSLKQYNNSDSEIYDTITRIAYSDFIENSLQNNLSKRLKMLISNGKILAGTMSSKVYTEAYQINLEDVNSVSKSINFYYHKFYKDTDQLTALEKETVESKIKRLEYLEDKKTLGPNQRVEYKSIKKELMDKLPDIADYFDISDTDGQEYSTWKNHLQQLLLQGRLTETEYDTIYKKLESQSKLNRVTKSNRLSQHELELALMQPTKPVHVGMYFNQIGDDKSGYIQQKMVYIKTASFPLIPQLTKGWELEKLRKVMEKLESSGDGTRTVRASYNSGNKVGGLKTAMTFDQITEFHSKSPEFIKDALQNTYTILDLSNYSIQQDKPFETFENIEKGREDRITRGTQMEKSILSDGISKIEDKIFLGEDFSLQILKDCGIIPNDATKESTKGLKVSGTDLKKIYDYLYEKEQNLLKKKLFDRFGITSYDQLNEPHVKEKIKRILDQRLDNDQDLEGIKLLHKFNVIENGELKHYELSQEEFNTLSEDTKAKIKNHTYDFNIAIWTLPNFRKFESILNSIVSNNSIKLELPGGHGIVASQKGFEIVSQENYKGSVILTDGFDGELKAVRDDDGTIKSAQVFVANKFRKFNPDANTFELINLEDYTIEKDGRKYLDTDRVSESVRTMFSYRIPTSSHQSGMRIEIVGFLPTECGDLVIVPKDSTKQMGEDFDIDVRYYYQHHIVEVPELKKDENTGEIVRSTRLQLLEQIDPERNYSKEIRENYFDFLKTVVETKIKSGTLIDTNDPIYNEYGINTLMRWAIILSGEFYGENKNYKNAYLKDLVEGFGATKETIKNINRLIVLIKEEDKLNDLQRYVNQTKFEEMELKSVENDLISIYKSVYSGNTENVQKKITAVLSTDFLNDTANAIQGTKTEVSEGYYTPLSMLSQLEIMKKGNAGKTGIGVWSALEVFIALVQQCQNPIKFNREMSIGKFNWDGTIGGYYDQKTQSYQCLMPEDTPKGFGLRTIFRNIMEHQNSATDNQKLQIMEKLNENEYTFGAYEMLILMGIDKDGFTVKNSDGKDIELSYSALFMSQPIIKDYVEKCAYYNSLSTDTWFNVKKQITDELIQKYKTDKPAQSNELTSENLYGNLSSVNNNIQITVLNTFFELEGMFDILRPYITKLNLEQRGLGKSFLDTINKKDFLLEIMNGRDTEEITGLDQLIGDFKIVGEDVEEDIEDEEKPIEEVGNDIKIPQKAQAGIQQLAAHSSHITFDESTHTYYINGNPVDISVTQLFSQTEQEPLNKERLTPMQVGAKIGTAVDSVSRDFFQGKLNKDNITEEQINQYGLSKSNIEQIITQLEKVQDSFKKRFGNYTVITDENLLRLAGEISYIDENDNPIVKTVAGTMDLLLIDENGDYHIFDFKAIKINANGDISLGENREKQYKNQGESYAKLLRIVVGDKHDVTFETDIVLSCVYPSANQSTYSLNENNELLIDGTLLKDSSDVSIASDFYFPNMKNVFFDNEKVNAIYGLDLTRKEVRKADSVNQDDFEQQGYVYFANDRFGRRVFIKPNGFYAHKIVNSISEGYNLWKNIFPYDESTIKEILQDIISNSDVIPGSETAMEIEYEAIESLQDFLYSSLQFFRTNGNTLNDTRKTVFFDTENNESFAHYVQRIVENNPKYKEMIFFKNLDYSIDLTGQQPSIIVYNVNAEKLGEKSLIYSMFKDFAESERMLSSWNGIQMSESLFTRFLIQYALLSNQNGATSFRKLVPIDTFNNIITITDKGKSINMKDNLNIITSPMSVNFLLSPGVSYLSNILGSQVNGDMIENVNELSIETITALINKYNTMYDKQIFSVDTTGNVFIHSDYGYRSNFVEQYFQHHPERVHKGSSKRFREYKKANNGSVPQRILLKEEDFIPYSRYDYISFKDGDNTLLYKVNSSTNSLIRMNLLGNQYFQEYSSTNTNNYSLISNNNVTQEQRDEREKVTQKTTHYKTSIDILNDVLGGPDNKFYNVAQYIKEIFTEKANAKVIYQNLGSGYSACFYSPDVHTITINTNYQMNKSVLQEKLLHEILHSLTANVLQSFIDMKDNKGVTFEIGEDGKFHASIKVKEKAPIAVASLIRVYKDAIVALQDDSPIGKIFFSYLEAYSDMLNSGKSDFMMGKVRKKVLETIKKKYPQDYAELEQLLNTENLFSLYYSSDPLEFVAGIFFNKPLMDKLNSIPVTDATKLSFAERFAKALTKLLDYIKSKLGIDVKSGFALDSVIDNITDIIRQFDEHIIEIVDEDVATMATQNEYLEQIEKDYQLFKEDIERIKNTLNAPIFTEKDITLGDRLTIDGIHYRLLNINGINSFNYAVSKVNGTYQLSTIQFDETVVPTIFKHRDFATLLYDFSKICDTFAKRNNAGLFENPYFFEVGEDQDFSQKTINKTYC